MGESTTHFEGKLRAPHSSSDGLPCSICRLRDLQFIPYDYKPRTPGTTIRIAMISSHFLHSVGPLSKQIVSVGIRSQTSCPAGRRSMRRIYQHTLTISKKSVLLIYTRDKTNVLAGKGCSRMGGS